MGGGSLGAGHPPQDQHSIQIVTVFFFKKIIFNQKISHTSAVNTFKWNRSDIFVQKR